MTLCFNNCMTKLLKWLLLGVGALVVLVLGLSLAVLLFVNPNDYRDEIVAALAAETGREVSLEGEIGLGVFPCCSLELGALEIGNPAGWKQQDFARIEGAAISLQLWPLLTRQEVRAGEITLDGLRLNLISRRDGKTNWEFPAGVEDSAGGRTDDEPGAATAGEPSLLDIAGIRITDAELTYVDEATGDRIRLTEINQRAGPLRTGEPIAFESSLRAEGLVAGAVIALRIDGRAELGDDAVALEALQVQLDDTRINGWLRAAGLEQPRITFDLQANRFDADRYLGDDSDTGATAGAGGDVRDTRIEVPTDTLRTLDLNGSLAIGTLVFEGAELADVRLTVAAKNGVLRLHPLTAKLYGGTYAGDVRLDVRGRKPALSLDEAMTGIALASLLADTTDLANLAGQGNVSIRATAAGDTVGELLEQLKGSAAFDLQEGIYQGFDLWYEIRKARARLQQEAAPPAPENPLTELSEFAGTLNFAGGKLQNPDFTAKLPFMRLSGSGTIDMLGGGLDYSLRARIIETPAFADGEELDSLKGLTLPIRITGTQAEPKIMVDVGELAKGAAEQKLRDRLIRKLGLEEPAAEAPVAPVAEGEQPAAVAEQPPQDAKDVAKDAAKDELKKQLRGLFD